MYVRQQLREAGKSAESERQQQKAPDAQRLHGDEVRHRSVDVVTMECEAMKQKLLDAQDDVAARVALEQQLADAIQSVATLRAQAPIDNETVRRQAA